MIALAGLVRWIGLLIAAILAVHVLLVVGNANPDNGITQLFSDLAGWFSLGFHDLFLPDDLKLRVLVNYGLAAVVWLIVTTLVSRGLRRLAVVS